MVAMQQNSSGHRLLYTVYKISLQFPVILARGWENSEKEGFYTR